MLRINAVSMRKNAAFIRGRHFIIFYLSLQRLFKGSMYSSNYDTVYMPLIRLNYLDFKT